MLFEQLLNEQAWRAWQKRMFEVKRSIPLRIVRCCTSLCAVRIKARMVRFRAKLPRHANVFAFADAVRAGKITGHWRAITDVVNLGIGGSDLGPRLICHALAENTTPRVHFVANIDPVELQRVLDQVDPETTLFILSSKSLLHHGNAGQCDLCARMAVRALRRTDD